MTLLTFPTGTTMLIDVCLRSNDDKNIEILKNELAEDNRGNKILDYLVITHPHNDHIKNIKLIPDNDIQIQNIWETGHRLYIASDDKDDYTNYYDMLNIISRIKAIDSSRYKNMNTGKISIKNKYKFGEGVQLLIMSPDFDIKDEKMARQEQEKLIHRHCAVLKIQYNDNSILFTGDSSYEEWESRITEEFKDELNSTILHVSHHGSHTFFTDDSEFYNADAYLDHINKIRPSVYIVSVGPNNYGHPNKQALKLCNKKTICDSSVYITQEEGTFITKIYKNNTWTIKPIKFVRERTTHKFNIKINVDREPSDIYAVYGKGELLEFSLMVKGDVTSIKRVEWQVQNNGQGNVKDKNGTMDKYHHELYYGDGKNNCNFSYKNATAYKGKHIICCTAYDSAGDFARDILIVPVGSE